MKKNINININVSNSIPSEMIICPVCERRVKVVRSDVRKVMDMVNTKTKVYWVLSCGHEQFVKIVKEELC